MSGIYRESSLIFVIIVMVFAIIMVFTVPFLAPSEELAKGVIYILMGLGLGIILFVKGIGWMRKRRLIENIPTSKVRSLAMGLVEIFGEAVPAQGKILKSPFSGKDCIYYRYIIDEYRSSGKSSRWVTVDKGDSHENFYLKDDTGSVLVDPGGANVDIPMDFEFGSGLGKDPPKPVREFLEKHGIDFEHGRFFRRHMFGFRFTKMELKGVGSGGFAGRERPHHFLKDLLTLNKKMRFREYFIAPGDKLYILGTAGDNPYMEEGTAKHGTEDVMIHKGSNEKTYYISDRPEKKILRKLLWKTAGGILGGGFLTVGSLFILLYLFDLF